MKDRVESIRRRMSFDAAHEPQAIRARLALGAFATAVVAVAARLPFASLPLTTDEGGYAQIARLWAGGARLYEDVWVDRPQGLLLVFRALLHVDGGSTEAFRLAAAAAGAALALSVLAFACRLAGARAGIAAGLLAAAAGAPPFLEAFTLAGELLAALPATLALLAYVVYAETVRRRWLVVAGLCAGSALMLKQSALEPALVVSALVVWRERAAAIRGLGLFYLALAAPLVAGAASAPSLHSWWYAFAGYRGEGDSLLTGGAGYRLALFAWSLPVLVKGLGLLLALAVLAWPTAPAIVRLWTLASVVGVLGGGNFHEHYFIQLVPPLAVAGGIYVDRLIARPRTAGTAVLAGAAAFTLSATLPVYFAARDEQVWAIFRSDRLLVHEWSTDVVVARTEPGDRVLVVPEAPELHYLARRRSVLPYLWAANVREIPGAVERARRAVAERAAAVVVVPRSPAIADPSGELGRLLTRNYRVAARRGSARVLVPRA